MALVDTKRRLAAELRTAIYAIPYELAKVNKTRYAARHYFRMSGQDSSKQLRRWINDPASIPDSEIPRIRAVLETIAGVVSPDTGAATPDYNKKVQRHTISLLSSLKALAADVDPSTVADDTRMHVTSALQTLACQFGIPMHFTDPTEGKSRPATASDFSPVTKPNKGRSQ